MDPIRLRLMTDDVTGIALWGEGGAEDRLEERLPIHPDLARRVRAWVDEYTDSIGDRSLTTGWYEEHDRRGYALSLELEAALGPDYDLVYRPETSVVRADIEAAGGKTRHSSPPPPRPKPIPGGRWMAYTPGSQRKTRPRPDPPDDQA
jgi:hypothetical protein